MPYPPYTDDKGYNEVIKTMLPIISTMSFVILCVTVVKRVVEEKQSGAKVKTKLFKYIKIFDILSSGTHETDGHGGLDLLVKLDD
jgi:hypothetical protein